MRFTYVLIGILCLLCLFNHGKTTLDAQQTTSIQIEQPYLDPNWRPKAGLSLTFEIRVTVPADFTSGTLNAVLQNVTNYIGESGNVPQQAGNTDPDLELSATTGWSGNVSTRSYTLNGTTTQTVSLQVDCKDYAAYGELKLTASGSSYTSNEVIIKIPKDDNGNKIADGWRNDGAMNYGHDDDNDTGINSNFGDNITVINEYRGLNVNGSWTDTDPDGWDVFIQSTVSELELDDGTILSLDPLGDAGSLPMTTHAMSITEVIPYGGGRVYHNEISRQTGNTTARVYAIRLQNDVVMDDGLSFGSMGSYLWDIPNPPSLITRGSIFTGRIWNYLSTSGMKDFFKDYVDTVIAHEIGHGVNLNHCPDSDCPDCYMWGRADEVTHHVSGYASHHNSDYDLTYYDGYTSQAPSNGNIPDRIHIEGVGVCVRQREDVNGDGSIGIIDLLLVTSYFGESRTVADVNDDGTVDISDLKLVANSFENPSCPCTQLPEDINGDNVVDILDLTLVASNFNEQGQNIADVNGDETVDILDLVQVAAAFGNTYG